MRILHLSNPVSIPPKSYGGTEHVVYSLAKIQAENDHEVSVIAGKPSDIPGVMDLSFEKAKIYTEKRFILKRWMGLYTVKAFRKIAQYKEFDIVHNHISEEAIPLSNLIRITMITTLHCPMSLQNLIPLVTTSVSGLLPRNTKFITISKRSLRAYLPFYGKDLIGYVHSGLNISSIPFSPIPKTDHEIKLCFLGKIVREKHPEVAIQVVDIIHELGYDVELLIIGKLDSPLSNYAKNLIKSINDRKYVTLLPNIYTNEIYHLLGNCNVFINPSTEIGLNLAQIESLATGTPVVGLFNGVAKEVVKEGQNGYLGENPLDLAKKCLIALDLDRTNCRRFVENNFSEQRMYKAYMKFYERVIRDY